MTGAEQTDRQGAKAGGKGVNGLSQVEGADIAQQPIGQHEIGKTP
jgi:hypothetical protein